MHSQKILFFTTVLILIQLLSYINCQQNPRYKRAIKTNSEYLESIKSLRFKKSSIFTEMALSSEKNQQNSVKIKGWIKKRSHSVDINIACSPKVLLWTDDELYSNHEPVEMSIFLFNFCKEYFLDETLSFLHFDLIKVFLTANCFIAVIEILLKAQLFQMSMRLSLCLGMKTTAFFNTLAAKKSPKSKLNLNAEKIYSLTNFA